MQRFNSPDQAGVIHYLTLNVRDRKNAFRRDDYAESIAQLLRFELTGTRQNWWPL